MNDEYPIGFVIKFYPNEERTCLLLEAKYTCEAKRVHDLTPCERSCTLGIDKDTSDNDYVVSIEWTSKDKSIRGFDYGFEKYFVVVRQGYVDHPKRDFVVLENEMHVIMAHIIGSPRLAIDMLKRPFQENERIKAFLKDWKQLQSYPAYSFDEFGVTDVSTCKNLGRPIADGQVRLWSTDKGRVIYGLVMPWTKHTKLVVPLSRYDHPARQDEMWTERYLYEKKASKFRAVYLLWNTRIVDELTIKKSWLAYMVSNKEYELVKQMIRSVFFYYNNNGSPKSLDIPINASSRVGVPFVQWENANTFNTKAIDILDNHLEEAQADAVNVFPEKSMLINRPNKAVKQRLVDLYGDQPSLNI